jgi:hypothetical protein
MTYQLDDNLLRLKRVATNDDVGDYLWILFDGIGGISRPLIIMTDDQITNLISAVESARKEIQ